MLEDGTYDVFVVDAEGLDASGERTDGPAAAIHLDLTVLGGDHKGELVAMTAHGIDRDPMDLLGVPGTVVVTNGKPHLALEG